MCIRVIQQSYAFYSAQIFAKVIKAYKNSQICIKQNDALNNIIGCIHSKWIDDWMKIIIIKKKKKKVNMDWNINEKHKCAIADNELSK